MRSVRNRAPDHTYNDTCMKGESGLHLLAHPTLCTVYCMRGRGIGVRVKRSRGRAYPTTIYCTYAMASAGIRWLQIR